MLFHPIDYVSSLNQSVLSAPREESRSYSAQKIPDHENSVQHPTKYLFPLNLWQMYGNEVYEDPARGYSNRSFWFNVRMKGLPTFNSLVNGCLFFSRLLGDCSKTVMISLTVFIRTYLILLHSLKHSLLKLNQEGDQISAPKPKADEITLSLLKKQSHVRSVIFTNILPSLEF